MPTTMKLIAKQTLGSNASTVTFSDIPGTYTDLYLVCSIRGAVAATYDWAYISLNGSTANFSCRFLEGTGTTTGSSANFASGRYLATFNADTSTASTFTSLELYFPNYAGSTNKSFSGTYAYEANSSTAYMGVFASLWSQTAAITSMSFSVEAGRNYKSGSSFFLYGITKS